MISRPRGLILQHEVDDPPDLLGGWLDEQGLDYELVNVVSDGVPSDPAPYKFVVSLGSTCSVNDASLPWVEDELELLRRCARETVAVLGICFGGQLLARSLGAEVWPIEKLEIGWLTVESADRRLLPEGPWPYWHEEAFRLPAGARALSLRGDECQAFLHGRSLGVQFHPESSGQTFTNWVNSITPAELQAHGASVRRLLEEAEQQSAAGQVASRRLFQAFFHSVFAGETPATDVGRTELQSLPRAVAQQGKQDKNQTDPRQAQSLRDDRPVVEEEM